MTPGDHVMRHRWIGGLLVLFTTGLFQGCAGLSIHARQGYEQGLSLFHQGRYEKSIAYFTEVIEAEPEHADAYLYLGRAYLSLGQWQQAVPPLRAAYRLAPEKARDEAAQLLIDTFFGLTRSYTKTGDLVQAVQTVQEPVTWVPEAGPGEGLLREVLRDRLLEQGNERLP